MEKYINRTILSIFFTAILLIAVLTVARSLPNLAIFTFSIIVLCVFYKLVKKEIIKINKKTIIIFIIIAFVLRLGLFLLNYDKPLMSDYLFFYENATQFMQGQELNNRYIATFPYLAPYVVILGAFLRIFNSNNYLLVILFHMILDFSTAFFIYKITGNKDKKTGMLGALLWLINPINIIWNTICCPVVIVNFGIAIILYVFEKIRLEISKGINWKKFLILNIIYGMTIGIFNSFRPIMIIIVIATIMYYIYTILYKVKQKKIRILVIIGSMLILAMYILINAVSNYGIGKLIKQEASTTPGWTLYLGSNIEYNGMWHEKASGEYTQLFNNEEMSAEEIQQYFNEKAIKQYKENGFKNIKLFFNKYKILTNNIVGYSYSNINEVATINNNILRLIRISSEIAICIIIVLNVYYCINLIKNIQIFENVILYLLVIIGLLASHMLVEVSPRYALPLMPIITIVATFGLSKITIKE